MKQVIPNVYWLAFMGFVNVYLIDNGNGMVLIDTGVSAGNIKQIAHALTESGRTLSQIRHVLITHAHPDHIGGLAALQKQITPMTYAHRQDARVIRGETPMQMASPAELSGFSRVISSLVPVPAITPAHVSVELKEGDVLDEVLPGLKVVELPGHSYGQVGFWWEEKKLLFGGDVLMRFPWGLRMPFRVVSPDWEAANQSIQRVAQMGVDTLCLGHGAPIIGGAAQKIQAFASKIAH